MAGPDISIIMPAYNSAPWLGQAVESVLLQQNPAWELLIVDDASTDATPDLARRYADLDPRVRALANAGQKGAGGARNTGLDAMCGRAAFFLDSDDLVYPGALDALHAALERGRNPVALGTGRIFCEQRWLTASCKIDSPSETLSPPGSSFCLHIYRADFLARRGIRFPEDLIISQDSAFLADVYSHLREQPERTDRPILLYRINHKPSRPSATKSRAFLDRFSLALDAFARRGKEDWIVPYLERYFLPEWLMRLHTVRENSREDAVCYLAGCLETLQPLRNGKEAARSLRRQLGPAADAFLAVFRPNDAEAALDILEQHHLLSPMPGFTGIDRNPAQPGWPWYLLSQRALNLARSRETRRNLVYMARLGQRSRQRLVRRNAGGSPC